MVSSSRWSWRALVALLSCACALIMCFVSFAEDGVTESLTAANAAKKWFLDMPATFDDDTIHTSSVAPISASDSPVAGAHSSGDATKAVPKSFPSSEAKKLAKPGVNSSYTNNNSVPIAASDGTQASGDTSATDAAPEWFMPVRLCAGLQSVPHVTRYKCRMKCLFQPVCCDWQFHSRHGCWLGKCGPDLEDSPTNWTGMHVRESCTSASAAATESMSNSHWNTAQGKLAVVVVVRNAAARIRDWLAFHVVQGVDHFFIVDDESIDDLAGALTPAIRRNYVTLLPAKLMASELFHPMLSTSWQSTIYNNVFLRFGSLFTWFGVWDVDEFMYSSGTLNLPDTLQSVRARFPACAGICVNWEIMGSMGLYNKSDGLMTETFTEAFGVDPHVKCISVSKLTHDVWVHHHRPFAGYTQYLETGQSVTNFEVAADENLSRSRDLHLNHYYHASREEFAARIAASRWPYKKLEHWRPERGQPQTPGVKRYLGAVRKLLSEWAEDDHGAAATHVARNLSEWDVALR